MDLIRPSEPNLIKPAPRLSKAPDDFDPAAIEGLLWLINAPKYEETLIAEDGMPVRVVTVDPRAYALHKLWLSRRSDRSRLKRLRDMQQARAVADVAINVLGLSFNDKALTALPADLMKGAAELERSAAASATRGDLDPRSDGASPS